MLRDFLFRSTRIKNPATVPWEHTRRKRRWVRLFFLDEFLPETVAFILAMCTHMDEINATFEFSVPPCLKRSGW